MFFKGVVVISDQFAHLITVQRYLAIVARGAEMNRWGRLFPNLAVKIPPIK